MDRCVGALQHEWEESGEDVFLRHCLGMLQVNRVDNFKLLSEDRCMWENPAQEGCTSGKVSFHPFKDIDSWLACYAQATAVPEAEHTGTASTPTSPATRQRKQDV